ncbi:MAG: riboflavin synthase [Porticoccaceae bacterium]|jgi:riboflavin synthase|nr:riboflavin synthase [Porticoccaceae bacterium]
MFTGIVASVGEVTKTEQIGGDLRLTVSVGDLSIADVQLGDSIMNNGICLTVIEFDTNSFVADLSEETLRVTTAGDWKVGTRINLEKSLTLQDRLGGHLVSGHVDGVGEVLSRETQARSEWFCVSAPPELAKYIAQKGSITVDGTSLTVNAVADNEFTLTIIPHTLENTVIDGYQPGTKVNLEVDLIARYAERLQQFDA